MQNMINSHDAATGSIALQSLDMSSKQRCKNMINSYGADSGTAISVRAREELPAPPVIGDGEDAAAAGSGFLALRVAIAYIFIYPIDTACLVYPKGKTKER